MKDSQHVPESEELEKNKPSKRLLSAQKKIDMADLLWIEQIYANLLYKKRLLREHSNQARHDYIG